MSVDGVIAAGVVKIGGLEQSHSKTDACGLQANRRGVRIGPVKSGKNRNVIATDSQRLHELGGIVGEGYGFRSAATNGNGSSRIHEIEDLEFDGGRSFEQWTGEIQFQRCAWNTQSTAAQQGEFNYRIVWCETVHSAATVDRYIDIGCGRRQPGDADQFG